MTLSDIAKLLDLTPQALYKLRRTHEGFPDAREGYGRVRLYDVPEVLAWYDAAISGHHNAKGRHAS
jgi:hypothetical protein